MRNLFQTVRMHIRCNPHRFSFTIYGCPFLHMIKTRRRSESAYMHQVHDNVMMYTSTCLHTRLPSNVRRHR